MIGWTREAGASSMFPNYISLIIVTTLAAAVSSKSFIEQLRSVPIEDADLEDLSSVINPQPFNYVPYMESVNGPLPETDLENVLDLNDRELAKNFDFDPTHLLTLMIDKAAAQNTAPKKFYEEMQDIMALQNRSKTEPKENSGSSTNSPKESYGTSTLKINTFDYFSEIHDARPSTYTTKVDPEPTTDLFLTNRTTPSPLLTTLEESSEEKWKITLECLEKKYNVSLECHGPDSVTPFRLAIMLPHFLNLGQKPFETPSYVSINRYNNFLTTTPSDYYTRRYRGRGSVQPVSYDNDDHTTVQVPSFFNRHEFGGLIPKLGNLGEGVRNSIIAIHLYSMYHDDDKKDTPVPFRTKCVLVKLRMDKSLLSDERRMRILQNNNVITEYGQLTSETSKLYNDLVLSEFYNKIFWKVFSQ